jgi:hypothetical protein
MRAAVPAALLSLMLALGSPHAVAHPDWYLARLKPPNGGQIRNAGAFHLELVVQPDELRLYVTDHFFNKFPTKNSSATAIVVSGDKVVKIELAPGGDNLFTTKGAFARDANMRIGILLNPHRYPPQAARFTPFQALNELAPPAARIEGGEMDGKPDN